MRALGLLPFILTTACSLAQDAPDEDLKKQVVELRRQLVTTNLRLLGLELKLARANKDAAAEFQTIEEGLQSEYSEIRLFVMNELKAQPAETAIKHVRTLNELLSRPMRSESKVRAIELIASLKSPNEAPLIAASRDASSEVRTAAAAALKAYGSDAAFSALKSLLDDSDRRVKSQAIDSVASTRRSESAELIVKLLRHERDEEVVEKGLKALGSLQASAAFQVFVDHLDDGSDSIKWASLSGLGSLGDARALPHLRRFLSSTQPLTLREISLQGLGKLKDLESLPAILEIARNDKDAPIREAACASLGAAGSEKAFDPLIQIYAHDPNDRVRRAGWEATILIAASRFDALDLLVGKFIERRMKLEAEDMFSRLMALGQRDRVAKTEDALAAFLFQEKDYKLALPHLKILHSQENTSARTVQLSVCYRELGDFEAAFTCLRAQLEKLQKTDRAYFEVWLALIETHLGKKESGLAMEEAYTLHFQSQAPDDLKAAGRASYDRAWKGLVSSLQASDEKERTRAAETIKSLSRHALPALVVTFRDETQGNLRPLLLPLGNAIASTNFAAEDLQEPGRMKQILEAWQKALESR